MTVYTFDEYRPSEVIRNHLSLGGASPDGERINVTSLYLERGGKPWIGVMGEFHFSRFDRREWYRELCLMRSGGVGIVSTYLFWIYHEESEGEFNFEGDRDIRAFVLEAARAGLEVVIRIGPWAHGECRRGGFPDWILGRGWRLRSNDPEYLERVRTWYGRIYEEVRGLFYCEGGPIIGVQLENELVGDAEHLLTLKRIAEEIGYRVPLWTVTGWNSRYGARIPVREVLPVFGGYPAAPWTKHIKPLPPSPNYSFCRVRNDTAIGTDVLSATPENVSDMRDRDGWRLPYELYPFATCELGGGIEATHHRRPVITPRDIYALALVKLGSGNNLIGYYMYHGGTNKIGKFSTLNESRATGYPNDYPILSYDFGAPISEYGEVREHLGLLNLLHLFAEDFGHVLAPMETVESRVRAAADDAESLRYAMRTDGKSGFVFVNRHVRGLKMRDLDGVAFEAMGVRFPEITVRAGESFFFPFRLPLGEATLEYATAQPVCRHNDAFFFASVPGVEAEYRFSDGTVYRAPEGGGAEAIRACGTETTIVTLPTSEAKYMRRLGGKIFVGDGCDLYLDDGELTVAVGGCCSYREWDGERFIRHTVGREFRQAVLTSEPVEEMFYPPYAEELSIGGERRREWRRLTVDGPCGMVEIGGAYDAAQIYADGELVADQYYMGHPWRVPARLLWRRECYLVMSEMKDDFYREF